MSKQIRTFRLVSLACVIVLTLGIAGLASAQTTPDRTGKAAPYQETAVATEVDTETPIQLEMGKPATTPLSEAVAHRYFKFKGKANQIVQVTVQKTSGNMAIKVEIADQNSVQLANAFGLYLTTVSLSTKLPQDGNYQIYVSYDNPGSGDFEAGAATVWVAEAKADAAATLAASN